MKRREFIALLGGAAAIGPLAARAQQPTRRVGLLMSQFENDPEGQARFRVIVDGLQQLGWTDGRNVRFDIRWTAGGPADPGKYAAELVALKPDVIFASGSVNVAALQRITRSVPIVFANIIDPVGAGFIASLARPGGNTTGFSAFEYSLAGKWLELLKELAPNLTRVAVLRDSSLAAGIGQYAAIQALAPPSLGVELTPIDVQDPGEIERAITAFAREPNSGLIVTGSTGAVVRRNRIIALALKYRLPNVYGFRYYPASGDSRPTGLMPSTCTSARLPTLIAFSRERSPPTCPCKRLPGTSWSSTLRPQKRSVLLFRRPCSPAPTR